MYRQIMTDQHNVMKDVADTIIEELTERPFTSHYPGNSGVWEEITLAQVEEIWADEIERGLSIVEAVTRHVNHLAANFDVEAWK